MGRIFTLDEARALMPQVKATTEPVYTLAASLAEELSQAEDAKDEARSEALRERLQVLVQSWQQSMQDLEAEVKGLWLVDFDSGDGYWCWAYPEEALDHWHSYEGGFRSRVPVDQRPGVQA
ncbi:hypothetical protein GETHOR_09120 [Geothrix oryzae]|jgi:hypothetical protein|uniref:DUF2203 family protein n=1 Tax=Geothrix oryzae TaxID=2927975 RepID=A0ABN6UVJ3_9BACT|nr:DUF2203 domain-containing protein [Geothrix oryzae]BDU68811.1 hypothetical protein GETHOR_09120 [Geothrix oryzae]